VARRSVHGDATLAGNPVTKSLRAGPREELIRRNNVNATGKWSISGTAARQNPAADAGSRGKQL